MVSVPVQQVAGGHDLSWLGHWAASPKGGSEASFVTIESVFPSSLAVLLFLSSPPRSANPSHALDVPVSR